MNATRLAPGARGIGLRPVHYHDALAAAGTAAAPDFVELISENFMVAGGKPRRMLRELRERYPIALHGVSLSIGSVAPLRQQHLVALRELVDEVDPVFVSDHLCFTFFGQHSSHELLPLAYTDEVLDLVAAHVAQVQDFIGRRILLENPSTYLRFRVDTWSEAAFLRELCTRCGCGVLLDINNVIVSCHNHGESVAEYVAQLAGSAIGYLHLAGHDSSGQLKVDTHDQLLDAPTRQLLHEVCADQPDLPTVYEWDDQLPDFATLVALAKEGIWQ